MSATRVFALAHAWLVLDFFGESRRSGEAGSTLTTTIFGQSTLGFVFAALLFPDTPPTAFLAANLSLSTLLVGFGVLGQPSRRDRLRATELLTRTAPMPALTLTAARALYGSFYVALLTIGLALSPAILAYWICGHQLWIVPAYLLVACALSGIVAGSLSLLLTLVSRLLGPARGLLVNGTARAALIGGGFVAIAICLRHLQGTVADLPVPAGLVEAWPPYWGARLLTMPERGGIDAVFLLGTLAGLFVLTALAERADRAPTRSQRSGHGPLARLDQSLARGGPLLGVVGFTSAMLYRSGSFRSKVLPIFGLPLAMAGLALVEQDPADSRILLGVTLQFPAIYLPFLIAFLAQADRPKTAWIFRASPNADTALGRRAALISLTTHVLLPVHLVTGIVVALAGVGFVATLSLAVFSLGLGILATSLAVRALDELPFTDDRDGFALDMGALMGPALVLAAAGGAFASIADRGLGLGVAGVLGVLAIRTLLRTRDAT